MARSDKLAYGSSEIFITLVHVFLVWFGVRLYGMEGVGIAFLSMYIVYIFLITSLVITRHDFKFMHSTMLMIYSGALLVLISFGTAYINDIFVRYGFRIFIFLYSIYWSIMGFVRLLGKEKIIGILQNVLQKVRIINI